jgi:hypothetical protein
MLTNLLFDPEKHIYSLPDGTIVPSVSEILRFLSREAYSDVNDAVLEAAARRGTAVHEACEQLDLTGECEIEEEYKPYVLAYMRFLKDKKPYWQAVEKAYYDPDLNYAGTVDRIGWIDDKLTLVDIKTTSSIYKPKFKAQLNGYKILAENGLLDIRELYILQLKNTGKYSLYPVAIDATEFMACLDLHNALIKKHPRGRIE